MNIQVQTSKEEEIILELLGFEDHAKLVMVRVAALLEEDTVSYLRESLKDSVEGHLRDLEAEDLHIKEAKQDYLTKLWNHKVIYEAGEPVLAKLGIKANEAGVIRHLAKAADAESIADYCRYHILMITEGHVENPELLGMAASKRLRALLDAEED